MRGCIIVVDSCTVENCSRPVKVKSMGICQAHYFRLRRNGNFGISEINTPGTIKLCSVDGCNRKHKAKGLCSMHVQRLDKWGDPNIVKPTARYGEDNLSWTGSNASYTAAHKRVYSLRGSAKLYACDMCGLTAKHWAYDHLDDNELIYNGMAYSTSVDHYIPMCVSCHKKYDLLCLGITTTREAL